MRGLRDPGRADRRKGPYRPDRRDPLTYRHPRSTRETDPGELASWLEGPEPRPEREATKFFGTLTGVLVVLWLIGLSL